MQRSRRFALSFLLFGAVLWLVLWPTPGWTDPQGAPAPAHAASAQVASAEATPAVAAEPAAPSDQGYATGGVKTCLKCHDETEKHPILAILKTPHGMMGDPNSPLGSKWGCQTCHGPSAAHVETPPPGQKRAEPAIVFGPNHPAGPENAVCLSCHQSGLRMNWEGSVHQQQGLACVSCHKIHVAEDPVLKKNIRPDIFVRDTQAQVCFRCHPQQRAQIHRISSHPILEGKVVCSDCHNPHGSPTDDLLVRSTINQTCYQCHPEKRGPFLWEHAPVRENCLLCHTPHGSNHRFLLKARVPFLCQRCHMSAYHPSTAYTASDLPKFGGSDPHLAANACLDCHSEIHGSNSPSGVRFTR